MKFKVGDKVQYDSGDWLFHGTVAAVIDNSICPCYRLIVDHMEKKNCRFSITQFEFELEADNEGDNDLNKRKWEQFEMEYFKKFQDAQKKEVVPVVVTPAPVQVIIPEPAQVTIPESVKAIIPEPVKVIIPEPVLLPDYESQPEPEEQQVAVQQELEPEVVEPQVIETSKRRRGETWFYYLDLYKAGAKSNAIYNWVADNRRQFKAGKLKQDKFEKLAEINFSFDTPRKKGIEVVIEEVEEPQIMEEPIIVEEPQEEAPKKRRGDIWGNHLELYKTGVRNSSIYNWVGDNRRQYKAGTLSEDRILRLIEIGFAFNARPITKKAPVEESPISKISDSWERNYELFKSGERSGAIFAWISQNRRNFKKGSLKPEHLEKLNAIKFPFEIRKKLS